MPSLWVLGLASVFGTPSAVRLHEDLARFASGIRVMYVAAHPDDEHTELIAYLSTGRHASVAYLSLTRGSGGQNRIGREQGPALGVLRTEELLMARAIDGGDQLFTRALDFGFSKSAEETLEIWGDAEILGDVVYAIRAYRPHVILTRFPETGETHGHHLASARLARRAFGLAADASAYPEQLAEVGTWRATRLVHDFPRFLQSQGTQPPADALAVDIGGYDPWRGQSHGEIAAQSRSQHRSQGFGTAGKRGTSTVRLVHLDGTRASSDLLEGIGGAWSELEGGAPIGRDAAAALGAFDPAHPERTVPALLRIRRALLALPAGAERDRLAGEVEQLLVGCAGLFADVRAAEPILRPGASAELQVEVLGRTPLPVRLESVAVDVATSSGRRTLVTSGAEATVRITIPQDASPSVLPWLANEPAAGRDATDGPARIAAWPEASLGATIEVSVDGERLRIRRAVRHVRADPVLGERVREVEIHPALVLTPERPVALAAPGGATSVRFAARGAPGRYEVELDAPAGWTFDPARAPVEIGEDGAGAVRFEARAGADAAAGEVRAKWRQVRGGEAAGASAPAWQLAVLDHPHVPERSILLPARVRIAPVALRSLGEQRWRVGYLEGPGDDVASSLSEAGMQVTMLEPAALTGDLSGYDAIVVGPRAFNARPELHERHAALLAYAEAGGTVIVQYQTQNRLEPLRAPIGPAALTLGRKRVTDETAGVELIAADHPALTTPHRIGPADFEGWVQERGLYFAEEWAEAYTPLLRMHDPGEPPAEGSLLVAAHGRGHFVYTGLSFFRQLPAGNAGAYRLFENLVALGSPGAAAARAETVEPEPPFGSWTVVYLAVGGVLAGLIALFIWLSRRSG